MQKIGDIPNTRADSNGEFTDGNVAAGVPPTTLPAEWFNTLQRELIKVVQDGGLALDPNDDTQVLAALKKLFLQSGNNLSEIKAAGPTAVAAALVNLGLKEAALRAVGTGTNQIPDMSYFSSSFLSPGYQRLPGGFVMQFGFSAVPIAGAITVNYPLAFTVGSIQLATPVDNSSINNYRVGVATSTVSSITLASTNTASVTGVMWLAIGKI
ncbi:bacteriophage tail fiber protein [Yersinia frederiksenii]|nr:bacteriophage tail fiber protein [Yersinia frederiksenii]